MTQEETQPPVTPPPDEVTDGGQSPPPTETEHAQANTAAEITNQVPLNYADHHTYAMSLYNQPTWVVDAVFASGQLDSNGTYTQSQVQQAIDTMMATPDSRFEEGK